MIKKMGDILQTIRENKFKAFIEEYNHDKYFKQMIIDFFVAGKGMDDIDWCDGCPYKSYRP